jgi:hypothetical protein
MIIRFDVAGQSRIAAEPAPAPRTGAGCARRGRAARGSRDVPVRTPRPRGPKPPTAATHGPLTGADAA